MTTQMYSMRELKFRVWDGEKMIYQENGVMFFFPYKGAGEVMQYTGLKDKNVKEIYEGDVVINGSGHISEEPFVVEWEYCHDDGAGYLNLMYAPECVEVIGNIYENPDLINN